MACIFDAPVCPDGASKALNPHCQAADVVSYLCRLFPIANAKQHGHANRLESLPVLRGHPSLYLSDRATRAMEPRDSRRCQIAPDPNQRTWPSTLFRSPLDGSLAARNDWVSLPAVSSASAHKKNCTIMGGPAPWRPGPQRSGGGPTPHDIATPPCPWPRPQRASPSRQIEPPLAPSPRSKPAPFSRSVPRMSREQAIRLVQNFFQNFFLDKYNALMYT